MSKTKIKTINLGVDLNAGKWRAIPPDQCAEGIWPNQLWHTKRERLGALVAYKPRAYEEYAINKSGLDYLREAEHVFRMICYVVLAQRHNGNVTVVASKTVKEVDDVLARISPRPGEFGLYYWMNADLTHHDDVSRPTANCRSN